MITLKEYKALDNAAENEKLFLEVATGVEIQLYSDQFEAIVDSLGNDALSRITIEDEELDVYSISVN